MLNATEKDNLYAVIEAVLGSDAAIKTAKAAFNDSTVDVVEKMVEANARCNDNMKQLITDLLSGARVMTKGWLKKAIGSGRKQLKSSGKLNGYGCRVQTKAHWKSAIILSTT